MKELHLGSNHEIAVERTDYPPEKVKEILKDEIVAVLGYRAAGSR